ncbi:hypothetical protein [Sphingomonas sp. BAUL-RG-20F-R05-02]|uniref:hypothetical protein n=1 Tax=Sphingomonas sp. BAUL-RG-20F-R05-02 TaxID=2914830 RepID=UPI001F591220|nr:hypothetical protein [Sphingomonas sp. BAUL-RG-20F-R05-02]
MDETIEQQQRRVAGYMAAIAQTLSGRPGLLEAFIDNVELIVAGSAANVLTLLRWGERIRRSGVPILLFSPTHEPTVPQITLIAHTDGRTYIIESCMLWMGRDDDRARLVPANCELGAFVFGDDLTIRHRKRAPARSLYAAMSGMKRAYGRLLDLEIEQRSRCAELPLPSLLPIAA